MAEQADAELNGDEELDELTPETGEDPDQSPGADDPDPSGEDDDEIEVSFDDEAAPASHDGKDSGLVRKLRAEIRDRDVKIAAFQQASQPAVEEVGEMPTIHDHDFDNDAFVEAYEAWKGRKAKADKAEADRAAQSEGQRKAWADELSTFERNKTALGAKDFAAAEEEVIAALDPVQQAVVVKAAKNSANVVYALGRHPERLKALAAIKDPIKLAAEVARMESSVKVTSRRRAPEPEGIVRGNAPAASGGADKKEQRLEAEADKTGLRTALHEYRRAKQSKA